MKVTILLKELLAAGGSEAAYDAWLIDIYTGDQFGSGFVDLNPNSKIPAPIDYGTDKPVRIFASGSILLYLAKKFGRFIPLAAVGRMECMSWLFWQVGSAPYLGGGFAHFYHYAPVKLAYAIDRFTMEAKRQLHVLDQRLAGRRFILGKDYSIADIASFPWYGGVMLGWWPFDAAALLSAHAYSNVLRWAESLVKRPAVQRGRWVNSTRSELPGMRRERHAARDSES